MEIVPLFLQELACLRWFPPFRQIEDSVHLTKQAAEGCAGPVLSNPFCALSFAPFSFALTALTKSLINAPGLLRMSFQP
jgi:hypothetical protein